MAKTALSCLLLDLTAGRHTRTFAFTPLDMLKDSMFFTVEPLAGRPFRIGFLTKAGSKLEKVNNPYAAYPAKNHFIGFSYPPSLKSLRVTMLPHGGNLLICCHAGDVDPQLLLADYTSHTLALAKYVTVPLPKE